jgi:hypothetical protein
LFQVRVLAGELRTFRRKKRPERLTQNAEREFSRRFAFSAFAARVSAKFSTLAALSRFDGEFLGAGGDPDGTSRTPKVLAKTLEISG